MACLEDITVKQEFIQNDQSADVRGYLDQSIKEEPLEIEEHKYSCTEQFQLDITRNQMELDISKYDIKKCFVRLKRLAPQHKEQSGKNTKAKQGKPSRVFNWRLQCSVCLIKFPSNHGLKAHILGVHGQSNMFPCPICKRELKQLKQHITTVHSTDKKIFSCSQCRATFSRKENMKVHVESVHLGIIRYCCDVCTKEFYHKVHFDDHMRRHNRVKPFQCPICYKKFVTKWDLAHHIVIHSDERKHKCALCPVTYNYKNSLVVHIETVHLGITRYCCDVCGYKCNHKSSFVAHMKRHDKNKPFQCKIIDKSHLTKDSAIYSKERNFYNCPQCSATFSLIKNVKIHLETVHLGVGRYCCDVCDHKFYYKSSFVVHMRRHNKPFHCSICNKQFVTKNELTRHSAIHSDQKNYSCLQCLVAFKTESGLKGHLENVHLGITKYCCDVCGHKFYFKSSFVVHMRRHNGNKPFHCMICNKQFVTKNYLTSHSVIHSDEMNYSCSHCSEKFKRKSSLKIHFKKIHK